MTDPMYAIGALVQLAVRGPAMVVKDGYFRISDKQWFYRLVWLDERSRPVESTYPEAALVVYVADEEWREQE